jgi:Ras family
VGGCGGVAERGKCAGQVRQRACARGTGTAEAWGACAGVGKTCLLLRYVDEKFSGTFITTIGP